MFIPADAIVQEEAPESVSPPAITSITPPPSAETENPTAHISVSIDPSSVGESAPEYSPAQKAESIPLDPGRKVHQELIEVPFQVYSDDDNLLSDHSFLEELSSATDMNARTLSVKFPAGEHAWRKSRAVSSPYTLVFPSVMQALGVARSVPSSNSESSPPTPVLMSKNTNVSPGISSRIKALEKFSSLEGTSAGPPPAVAGLSVPSSFESLCKRVSISPPNRHQGSNLTNIYSPDLPASFTSAQSVNRHDSPRMSGDMRRANSVSVTAHIVRDADIFSGSSGVQLSKSDVHNLQAIPLAVEYETAETPSRASTAEPFMRPEDRSTPIQSAGSGRQAPSRLTSASVCSRSRTNETFQSASSTSEDKKASRASPLMRPMPKPPVNEEDYAPIFGNGSTEALGTAGLRASEPIDIGEVNVQFPETYLWKRRSMRVDGNGYVVLKSGTDDVTARNITKSYHLTKFRTPYVPDEDMQDLPNSILLDFLDGNTLRCACESRQGQVSALQSIISSKSSNTRE
ncbi:hypothetical protein N7471_013012 [Penicillium samsonianum]|uniref:uncharacterized protein n=1 Tax=Penicillium samsonianum TaxID=1882272 RepID=UPI002547A152|nr:uncharacterized protein N7471_013012 [Penicillium samsonianum]KAJ6119061.1 hypothetical protein N7471_013012 [Penicillium samsonianum]